MAYGCGMPFTAYDITCAATQAKGKAKKSTQRTTRVLQ
jgi:hypothetical protein